ncbi:MAG: alpha/beta hydrolase [Paracoccaceae bacterium]
MCVLVHGRGQVPEDMVEGVIARLSLPWVAFALPRAAGKSWYKARAADPLSEATEGELERSLEVLDAAVRAARAAVPGRGMLLAGFSQGACLAVEYALRRGPWDGALAALTGARVGSAASVSGRPRAALGGMEVYLSGGDADPWIPPQAWAEAAADFAAAGAHLLAEVFPGRPHEVSGAEIAVVGRMLAGLAAAGGARKAG